MWEKQGLIYCAKNQWGWDYSHATHPVVDYFSNTEKWRIYFSSRDKNNLSHISFIDVEPENPKNIYYEHNTPILKLGSLGEFDEFGIMPTSIIKYKNKLILYYIGFSVKKSVPFENFIGAAISDDGINFEKINGPILGKDTIDPYFTGTFCVFKDKNIFRGYYMSGLGWEIFNNKAEPIYNIKYAESKDAIKWKKKDRIIIDLENQEAGICQATITKDNDLYRMWYCNRNMGDYRTNQNDSYKISYAESIDSINWTRKNDSNFNLNISEDGWDNLMTCYPWVFNYNDKRWMFYNGNSFGATGFGFAKGNI